MNLKGLLCSLYVLLTEFSSVFGTNVTFDNRAFIVDGARTMIIAGSIHYPRMNAAEWPHILKSAKANGINLIQTYVFWDIHEPAEGSFYFPNDGSSADIVEFIKECDKQGLFVNLRFGPYVCAEWNYGGFPAWLRELEGVKFRTMNDPFLEKMTTFVDKTLEVVSDAKLLASEDGPIVMVQIENEFGNMEPYYPQNGADYVQWNAEYALSKNLSIPWMMCQQGEGVGTAPPKNVINSCNGYYCDNWIEQHAIDFPNQVHMWTENWPGWFQAWGEPVPHRPAVDVAFSVARWIAKGGTYMNYYMAFGGTTFGRKTGGPLLVTSYDYDVQISEFGLNAEPKYSLTQQLHSALFSVADVLLSENEIPSTESISKNCEVHQYGQNSPDKECVSFLSNIGTKDSCAFDVSGGDTSLLVEVPAWSVTIVRGTCKDRPNPPVVLINTKSDAISPNKIRTNAILDPFKLSDFETYQESIPAKETSPFVSDHPLDQLTLTQDAADYLWVSSKIIDRETAGYASVTFAMGQAGGPVMYAYVNGKLASSTLSSSLSQEVAVDQMSPIYQSARDASDRVFNDTLAKGGVPVHLDVELPAGNSSLDLLVASTGIKNYGPYLEKIQVGIISDILVDDVPLTEYSFVPGLDGERLKVYSKSSTALHSPSASSHSSLMWYTSTFPTPDADSYGETKPIALDISKSGLTKGAIWVNGEMLGRYWTITATGSCDDDCSSENYVGPYNANRCRTGCGEMSQSLYKIPYGLLHSYDSGEANWITFFEEGSGSPEGVDIVSVSME